MRLVVGGRALLPPECARTVVSGERLGKGPSRPAQSLLESCASQQMVGIAPAPSSRLSGKRVVCEERQVEQEGWEGLELLLLADNTSLQEVLLQ